MKPKTKETKISETKTSRAVSNETNIPDPTDIFYNLDKLKTELSKTPLIIITTSKAKEEIKIQTITTVVLKKTLETIKITNNANWTSKIKNLTTMAISDGFTKAELDIYWKLIPKKEDIIDSIYKSKDSSNNNIDYYSEELMCDRQEWDDELLEYLYG